VSPGRRASLVSYFTLVALAGGLASCASPSSKSAATAPPREILISVKDQKLALMEQGRPVAVYPVSTSKFCVGDTPGSYGTPLGRMRVVQKIGCNAPLGAVFKHRHRTGEILPPNAPGRDPIVTRILRLTGQESSNARAFARHIYIHGTPEESTIGRPASYGCVRMKSQDVVDLYNRIPNGTEVNITPNRLPGSARALARRSAPPASTSPLPLAPEVAPVLKNQPKSQTPLMALARFGPPSP